jgi:hypothetical protein
MKFDPGIHIVKHLVFFGKIGVTVPGLGLMMMTPSVQHCGASKIQSSTPIF